MNVRFQTSGNVLYLQVQTGTIGSMDNVEDISWITPQLDNTWILSDVEFGFDALHVDPHHLITSKLK